MKARSVSEWKSVKRLTCERKLPFLRCFCANKKWKPADISTIYSAGNYLNENWHFPHTNTRTWRRGAVSGQGRLVIEMGQRRRNVSSRNWNVRPARVFGNAAITLRDRPIRLNVNGLNYVDQMPESKFELGYFGANINYYFPSIKSGGRMLLGWGLSIIYVNDERFSTKIRSTSSSQFKNIFYEQSPRTERL